MFGTDSLILGKTLREHVGGRFAIPWILVVLGAPFGLLAGLTNMANPSAEPDLGLWIVNSLIGVIAAIAVLALAEVTFFRHRSAQPVPLWWVVVLGAAAGASRSTVTVWLAYEWSLVDVDPAYAANRIVSVTILGSVALPLAALATSVVSSYRTQRRELELQLRDVEVQRMRQTGRTEALREALIEQTEAELALAVESTSADDARAASHRLWESTPELSTPRVRWTHVMRVVLTHNPYPTLLVVVVWTLAAVGTLVVAVGVVQSLIQIALSIAGIVGIFSLARWMTDRLPQGGVVVLILAIVAMTLWTGVVAPVIAGGSVTGLRIEGLITTVVWVPLLVILSGVVVSAVKSSDEVVERLREAIKAEQVAVDAEVAETARVQQELATLLHGSVQSRLLAAAAIIRQPTIAVNGEDDSRIGLEGALAQMSERLSATRSLRSEIDEMVRLWTPLMDVTVEMDDADLPSHTQDAIVRIAEEGLSNAYRHGGASQARAAIHFSDEGVSVCIFDNGRGPDANRTPGLGSAVLDSLAPGAWTLERKADGWTVLQVLVPLHS